MDTQVPYGGLTSVEQSLVECVRFGEWHDLAADDEAVDEAAMLSWGESRTCRASVIRDILRGRLVADPDPHGLRLRGAKITGRLDLENLVTDVWLELAVCLLPEGVVARDARLAGLTLTGCQIEHHTEPPLDGARLTCSALSLESARIIGHTDKGAVDLTGAHIGGLFSCAGADLSNDSGPALNANRLQVEHDMSLRGGFTATGSGPDGAVNLTGAHIGGELRCTAAKLCNDSGPALDADGIQVDQGMPLSVAATGVGILGAVRLNRAHIGGQLSFISSKLSNDSGPALYADRMQVDEIMYFGGGFVAAGSGDDGAVSLVGAHIGELDCAGAQLRNDSGPALSADKLQVGLTLYLRGLTATGAGGSGAVRLTGAHISGQLSCPGAQLRNDSGPALSAESLQVDGTMILIGLAATGGGTDVAVDLTGARVGGALYFDPARLEHADDPHWRLRVDGLTYPGVPQPISARDWLDLLRDGTPWYAAQPYQQLAAGYLALGDERQAREILMAQRDDQLTRTDTRWPERWWGKITKITLGYGYQPWRALLFLAALVVLSCLLAVSLGSHGALAQTSSTATPSQPCTVIQKLSVGLDLNLPVGTSLARAGCDLAKNAPGAAAAWLTAIGWVLRVLAWVFAALFIAGFTSAVRKT